MFNGRILNFDHRGFQKALAAEVPLGDVEAALSDLRRGIQLALAKRDYERAALLQTCLRQSTLRHERLLQRNVKVRRRQCQAKLEQERESEQAKVLEFVQQKLSLVRDRFAGKYAKLECRHAAALEEVQRTFSNPIHIAVRLSSIIHSLQRAEAYYVRTEDYQSAAQIRRQIGRQAAVDFSEFESAQRNSIEARIRDATSQHHTEQQTFAQRLRNEANLVRRDANRMLTEIDVRYRKLLHNLTGSVEQTSELNAAVRSKISEIMKRNLQEFAAELQTGAKEEPHEEEQEQKEQNKPAAPGRPQSERSPRRIAPPRTARAASARRPTNPRVEMALARANQSFDLVGRVADF
jgi:hypothetical protein